MSHKILTNHDIITIYMYVRMCDDDYLHNKILHKPLRRDSDCISH